jgi:hypothetical protein
MRDASKPMSDISCVRLISDNPGGVMGATHRDELLGIPEFGVIFDDASLSEERNFDGMDSRLISKHTLDGLGNHDD